MADDCFMVTARDIDLTSGDLNDSGNLPLPVAPRRDMDGMEALRAEAVASPAKTRDDSCPDFHEFVKGRVDNDTANLATNFELDTKFHRFTGRKTTAAKALLTLTPLEAMSDLYQTHHPWQTHNGAWRIPIDWRTRTVVGKARTTVGSSGWGYSPVHGTLGMKYH